MPKIAPPQRPYLICRCGHRSDRHSERYGCPIRGCMCHDTAAFQCSLRANVDDDLTWYRENHVWRSARLAALRRDGHRCTRCGAEGRTDEAQAWKALLRILTTIDDPDTFKRQAALAIKLASLEVHHIVGVHVGTRGYGSAAGCGHHLDNLVTLCRPCHVIETRKQRAAGLHGPHWTRRPTEHGVCAHTTPNL